MSSMRGPEQPISFAGTPILNIIPVAVAESGNITVAFDVLSYAGTLTITAVADPDHVPDLPVLAECLRAELDLLSAAGA